MKLQFNVPGKERKQLVSAISALIGTKEKYMGPPSFAYAIGDITVDRDGFLETEDENLVKNLKAMGFVPVSSDEQTPPASEETTTVDENPTVNEPSRLSISVPNDLSDGELLNLHNLITAKEKLMMKAFDAENLDIIITQDKIEFPWFEASGDSEAYALFVSALIKMSKQRTRINKVERDVENEKYAFRCFLLALGFIGDEYKAARKTLLRRLSGSASFKSGKKKEEPAENAQTTNGDKEGK